MSIITLNGSPFHTSGALPTIGTKAPEFILTKTDLSEIKLKNYTGKRLILNIFPSLDTATCAMAMREFNKIAAEFTNSLFLCVSEDLPFAQQRFCTAEHLNNVLPVSAFRNPEFGEHYGVMMIDGPLTGMLSRAVVIIDEHGKVTYTEQVKEISNEPNYTSIVKALKMN